MSDCHKLCMLYQSCKSPHLPGHGYRNADLAFVGEAPGAEEDEQGIPFVGKAGGVLDKAFGRAGIKRNDVWITNVLKCRPPDNRDPTDKEIKACRPQLIGELKAVNPKVVVALGNPALFSLTGKKGITTWRGSILSCDDLPGIKIIPALHPAASFHRGGVVDQIVEDFEKAVKILEGRVVKTKRDYKVLLNSSEATNYLLELKKEKIVAFDLETTGYCFLTDRILCISFSHKSGFARVIPLVGYKERPIWRREEGGLILKALGEWFESDCSKEGQNIGFDVNFCRAYGWKVNNIVFDTMIAHHLVDENSPHDLDYLSSRYTDIGTYKAGWKKKYLPKKDSTFADVPEEILWERSLLDADVTRRVSIGVREDLTTQELWTLYNELSNKLFKVTTKAYWNGIKLNEEKMGEIGGTIKKRLVKLEDKLYKLAGKEFNPDSSKQFGEILFKDLGLPVIKRGKTRPSTDESVLVALRRHHPITETMLERRKCAKALSTYIGSKEEHTGLWQHMGIDNRIHVKFNPTGTVTGRISGALHTIPRPAQDQFKIRNLLTVPEDCYWMGGDLSQAELKVLAWYAQEKTMLKVFEEGGDIHDTVGCEIFGCKPEEITSEMRMVVKAVDFGISYGRGPQSIAEELGIPLEEAKRHFDSFFAKFPSLKGWMDEEKRKAQKLGYVRNAFGRYRRFPELKDLTERNINMMSFEDAKKARYLKSEMFRQVINFLIQGSTSDSVSMATIRLDRRYEYAKLAEVVKFVMTHHDALYWEVLKEVIILAAEIFIEEMEKPIPQLGGLIIPADLTVGRFWGDDSVTESVAKKLGFVKNSRGKWRRPSVG